MLFTHIAYSQVYTSEKLYHIAAKVGVSADTLKFVGYHDVGRYNNRILTVGVSSDSTIFHIGYKLFAEEMRSQIPSEVYNFLERYLLELDCIGTEGILQQYLVDDGVRIIEGNLQNAKRITPSTPFSFTRIDNVYYDINWTEGAKTLLRLQFPINFELLLGTRKSELELKLQEMLTSESSSFLPSVEKRSVEIQPDGYFRSSPLETYELETLNTASYYERNDSNTFVPVYDDEQHEYSLHNLFRGMVENQYSISIKQYLYGYKQTDYTVSLAQWLNYCKSKSLRIYVGVEQNQDDDSTYKVLIVAQSDALAYNHLLAVIVPKNFMAVPNATFDATLNGFIPTHNIKTLYQEAIKK